MTRMTNEQALEVAEHGSTAALYAETKRARAAEEMRGEVIKQLRAEIARLQREVEHRIDEMNLQARWAREAQEKVERLRAALKPFADAAKRVDRMSGEGAALVSVADLRTAQKAAEEK